MAAHEERVVTLRHEYPTSLHCAGYEVRQGQAVRVKLDIDQPDQRERMESLEAEPLLYVEKPEDYEKRVGASGQTPESQGQGQPRSGQQTGGESGDSGGGQGGGESGDTSASTGGKGKSGGKGGS